MTQNPRYLGLAEILFYEGELNDADLQVRNCKFMNGKGQTHIAALFESLKLREVVTSEEAERCIEAIASKLEEIVQFE